MDCLLLQQCSVEMVAGGSCEPDEVEHDHMVQRRWKGTATYDGPARKAEADSGKYSSSSEFLREPGTDWTEKR